MAVQSNPPSVRMTSVSKIFSDGDLETHALSQVYLEIRRGEFVAVIGPSRAGKSTLLSVMGLLESQTHGAFELMGISSCQLSGAARAKLRNQAVGLIFPTAHLIDTLTVWDNVELPLRYGLVDARTRHGCVADALARVGMQRWAQRRPMQLPAGQRKLVAVARALVTNPALILADEPTADLDADSAARLLTLLGQLHAQGSTICMATQDARLARHASRTLRLFDGRIVAETEASGRNDISARAA
jgi:putative ABC transport system ATP-binding protein